MTSMISSSVWVPSRSQVKNSRNVFGSVTPCPASTRRVISSVVAGKVRPQLVHLNVRSMVNDAPGGVSRGGAKSIPDSPPPRRKSAQIAPIPNRAMTIRVRFMRWPGWWDIPSYDQWGTWIFRRRGNARHKVRTERVTVRVSWETGQLALQAGFERVTDRCACLYTLTFLYGSGFVFYIYTHLGVGLRVG